MTLLSIVQAVADEVKETRPTAVITSTEPSVQNMLRLANKVGKRMAKVFPWQILRKEQTFTSLAAETQTSILPSDFDRFIPETFWDRTNAVLITGPIGPVEWQGLKANSYSDTSNPKFILRGGSVLVIPTPSAGDSWAFEYVSTNWCQSNGGTGQTAWAADTDTGVINEELIIYGTIWEYLESEGQPAGFAAGIFGEYFYQLIENDQPNARILVAGDIFGGGRHFAGAPTEADPSSIV